MEEVGKLRRPRTYLGNVSFKPAQTAEKRHVFPWIIAGVVALVLSVGGLAVWQVWDRLGDAFVGGITGLFRSDPLKRDALGRTNVLVFGTEGWQANGADADGGLLTDSIMLISINQDTGEGVTISLPRDLWVERYCYGNRKSSGKLNETYSCAIHDKKTDDEAARALASTVGDILGVEVHYYARINYLVLEQATDAVGGINVQINRPINDSFANIYFAAGSHHLNGSQALALARTRHGLADGDFGRGLNPQLVMRALQTAVLEDKKYLTPSTALNLLESFGDCLKTNFSTNELRTLIDVGTKGNLRSLPIAPTADNVYLVRTDMIGEASVVLPGGVSGYYDYSRFREYFAAQAPTVNSVE
jgi:LCP family protein required for cell wall assembly